MKLIYGAFVGGDAQIIPITSVNNTVAGYMIKFKTFRVLPGPAAATVDSLYAFYMSAPYQASAPICLTRLPNLSSGVENPSDHMSVWEVPFNPFQVTVDLQKKTFNFYPISATTFTGAPDHTNSALHFVGGDGMVYVITYAQFVGGN